MDTSKYPLLHKIAAPAELRKLDEHQLPQVADELRAYMIEAISQSGGHFGAGLGCIELTVALHYCFNTPYDRLIWDVGHQAYPHKILTGRADTIGTIKKTGGLAPFPKRSESEYDTFGVGHSSTSVSAGLGMALASALQHENRHVVPIIGDGAMTAGMVFEALNHGGTLNPNMLVILNDNQMSISPNVGSMTKMLGRLMSGPTVTNLRESGKKMISRDSRFYRFMSRWEEHVKGMIVPSTLFEELGFNYIGPIDGHDVPLIVRTLNTIKTVEGPNFLHIITVKGKGYEPAEKDPVKYHAVSPFDPAVGMLSSTPSVKPKPTYTDVFSEWICDMAETDESLLAITPAMREGSGLVEFEKRFAARYFDVSIAEQHAVTLAAGMACEGAHPVVAIYSTFLQRAYDQLIHDVAMQNLPVLFAIDRAGLVGSDGPTHAGSFDLSFMRCIPKMLIMAPSDENECRQMLYTGFMHQGPAAVRYPRGRGPGVAVEKAMTCLPIGKAEIISQGKDIAILAFGSMLDAARNVGSKLGATVVNMRFVKPLDETLIKHMANTHKLLITIEENAIAGGAGSAVNEVLCGAAISVQIQNIGLPDRFIDHGSRDDCLAMAGLDVDGILAQINGRLKSIGESLLEDVNAQPRPSSRLQ